MPPHAGVPTDDDQDAWMRRVRHIHFIGIGGAGMGGIAEVLQTLGYSVSGSDLSENPVTARLRALGVQIAIGHEPDRVDGCEVVVVSTAIAPDNPELVAAKERLTDVTTHAMPLGGPALNATKDYRGAWMK